MDGNRKVLSNKWLSILIIVAILVVDQVIKIVVKTNMSLGQSIRVTDWFYIDFIENAGMAYGMTFVNKLFLSIMRILAICVIGWYIYKQIKAKARTLYIVLLSLVVAGAAGNIFDSIFYGLIFNASSSYYVSYFVPFGTGYAGVLAGKVVDMFYFPLIVTTYPSWVPFWGGREFIFFSPVFNFADASISVGVIALLIFCRRDLGKISFSLRKKGLDKKA